MSESNEGFHWELVKLMLQVAWADDIIEPEEERLILGMAKRLSLSDSQIAQIKTHLSGEAPLPPPNMAVLRERKSEVIQVAEQLVLSDNDIAEEENEVLAQITELLS